VWFSVNGTYFHAAGPEHWAPETPLEASAAKKRCYVCRNPKAIYELKNPWAVEGSLSFLPGGLPEWPGLSDFLEGGQYLMEVFPAAGKPIVVKTPAKEFPWEKFEQVLERDDSFSGRGVKLRPIPYMLFRPEEIHGASGVRPVFRPFSQRDCNITHYFRRFDSYEIPIAHFHRHWIATI
jgi:hypothetical protein